GHVASRRQDGALGHVLLGYDAAISLSKEQHLVQSFLPDSFVFSFSFILSQQIEADDDRGGDSELSRRSGWWRSWRGSIQSNNGSKTSHHGIPVPLLDLFNGVGLPDLVA